MTSAEEWSISEEGRKIFAEGGALFGQFKSDDSEFIIHAINGRLEKASILAKYRKLMMGQIFQKVIRASGWFERRKKEVDQTENKDEDMNKIIQTQEKEGKNKEDRKKSEGEEICQPFLKGGCPFGKGNLRKEKCPRKHPPTCKNFDKKGKLGCPQDPCPHGKTHRVTCRFFVERGSCRYGEECRHYHPTHLGPIRPEGQQPESQGRNIQSREREVEKTDENSFLGKGFAQAMKTMKAEILKELKADKEKERAKAPTPPPFYHYPPPNNPPYQSSYQNPYQQPTYHPQQPNYYPQQPPPPMQGGYNNYQCQ